MVKNQPFLQQVNIPHIVLLKVSRNYICPLYGEYLQISPPHPSHDKVSRFIDSNLILLSFLYYIIQVLYFFSHGFWNHDAFPRKYKIWKKLYNSLGTITPPPHPNQYLPWGSHFRYIFLWEKGKYVKNQKYSYPLYYNWHLFLHVLWKSYFFWIWSFQYLLLIFTKKNGYKTKI